MIDQVRGGLGQHAGLDAGGTDHVIGHQQNILLCIQSLCLSTAGASSAIARARGWPAISRLRTAMKCDLPLPKLPCS
jgi:hypothetical protein